MKFRKKSSEVEAFQLGSGQMPAWFMREVDAERIYLWPNGSDYIVIISPNGLIRYGHRGDYVIMDDTGSIFPCKEEIFNKTYESGLYTTEEFEAICERVHNAWWDEKIKQGVTDHPDMLPYSELSEKVKEYDRATVRAVLDALKA